MVFLFVIITYQTKKEDDLVMEKYILLKQDTLSIQKFNKLNPDIEYHFDKFIYKMKKRGYTINRLHLNHGNDNYYDDENIHISYWEEVNPFDEEGG
jgi:hypothetical protein